MSSESLPSRANARTADPLGPRRLYRFMATAEVATWSLLIIGMLLKYVAQLGGLPVVIAGSIHGVVFITYALMAGLVGVNQRWNPLLIAGAIATAIVPFATVPFDRYLERRKLLDGDWHRAATDDPRDSTWVRRTLRWLLNRPRTLSALYVLGVVVILAVFLLIGPPGGWSSD